MDFNAELRKLLDAEFPPPDNTLMELARTQAGLLEKLQKDGTDISLQIEEIYDIVKESDANSKELRSAIKREGLLLDCLVATSDLLDGLLLHVQNEEHTGAVNAERDKVMHGSGLERLGFIGERLDPRLHKVASAKPSDMPIETVIRVLESGYSYRGKVIRKATVILSSGAQTQSTDILSGTEQNIIILSSGTQTQNTEERHETI